ncbi:MAG: HD domain-containing protein [Chloroflexi bacterium]|nr:HD domain-containing protein [Chloroflexota bacterium]
MEYKALLAYLDDLLQETYALWDAGWVTFNWRAYTYDHVQRVRGLALTLAAREGADRQVVELAALLHDLTKPYDGEYLTDSEGKRVVDAQGYWQNQVRRPNRTNHVTDLYDRLGLAGRLHNESGALIAQALLKECDCPTPLVEKVGEAIRQHLRPDDSASLEARCLYDADTIDANIGLPAFVRNIYINLHFHDRRKAPDTPPLEWRLQHDPQSFLDEYIRVNLPRWVQGKRQDFVPRLLTATARQMAHERLLRLERVFEDLAEELPSFNPARADGRLAVVWHYMLHRDDPSIAAETAALASDGLVLRSEVARELISQIEAEMAGHQ